MDLKGSKTEQHLRDAFAGESQANICPSCNTKRMVETAHIW